jgi:threonylcarbamoyladenosine tRNA methylthiotransferase MtaB
MNDKKINFVNLGCRLNIYEGEVIKSLTKKNNITDYTIINSCAVTKKAEKKVCYEIRKAKKNFPSKKIIVTGCAAQINPLKYSKMTEVDIVVGNNEKLNENTWKRIHDLEKIQVSDIFEISTTHNHLIEKFDGKARAYIEIQQGCDHRCTFCIIPYGRGNNRSVPVGVVVERVKSLVNNGYKEVVLTGVDITDYGSDLPGLPNLFQLLKRILALVPELEQLRLSSIDCAEISNDFWPLLSEERLMPHFHLSLQAGNNLILKRMKRRHTKQQAIEFCTKVKNLRKDVVFGADIIAGFPTENEEMFEDSISLIQECNLTHLHIFPFSARESTPATNMPQVPNKIIKKRAKILRDLGNENLKKYLNKQVGTKKRVLIEKVKNSVSIGKSQHYTKIEIPESLTVGSIVECVITNVHNNISRASLLL